MANEKPLKDCDEKIFINEDFTLLRVRLDKALKMRADIKSVAMSNKIVIIQKTDQSKVILRICSNFMNWIQVLYILFTRRLYIFVRSLHFNPLSYMLKRDKITA